MCGCVHYLSIVIILYLVHTNVEFVVECVLFLHRYAGGVKGKVCVCVPQLYSELTPLHASLNRDDALSVYKMTAFQVALICVFTVLVIFLIFGILQYCIACSLSLPPSISLFPSSFSRTDL